MFGERERVRERFICIKYYSLNFNECVVIKIMEVVIKFLDICMMGNPNLVYFPLHIVREIHTFKIFHSLQHSVPL